jgi:4-amino-4-deoxy-L-arabinose transferase-like glycosyltransferase
MLLAAIAVIIPALVERIALWLYYPMAHYSDSGSYTFLAARIVDGWKDYNGTRLPGYPLFIVLFGSERMVYLAQLVLGLVMTAIIFYIGWQATHSPWFGLLAGLGYTLNLGQLFFEADLLSEPLTTFWITLMVLGVFLWLKKPGSRSIFLAILIGAAAGMAGLTRPLFIFLPFWAALFLALSASDRRLRIGWTALLGVAIPGALILGAWVNFIHSRFGFWNLSTMTGYNLIQHTGYFFEYVPDKYAALRDVYIQYRDARMAQYGTQGNAIWDAIPAMEKASGMGFTTLSQTLTQISLQLIWEHPTLYLHTVWSGWLLFWRAPFYWQPDAIASPALREALVFLVTLQRYALVAANAFFLITSLLALAWKKVRQLWKLDLFLAFLAATVWITSILQTLPDHGDNPRFLVPAQTLVVFWVIWIIYHWIGTRHASNTGAA